MSVITISRCRAFIPMHDHVIIAVAAIRLRQLGAYIGQ